LNLSSRAKVVLVLVGLFIAILIAIFVINARSKKTSTAPDATPTSTSENVYAPDLTKMPSDESAIPDQTIATTSGDQINYISATATSSPQPAAVTSAGTLVLRTPASTPDANGIRTYDIDITPAPNAGPYDWTRTINKIRVTDISESQIAKKSACELTGFSDNWSNIFSKISCDMVNFIDQNIVAPLMELNCNLTASNIQQDTGRTITYQTQDGACLIIDRQ